MALDIIAPIITAAAAVLAVILSNSKSSAEMDAKLDKAQAITDTKLDELTREVREHNEFARRMPVLEERMRVASQRLDDLERGRAK